MPCKTNPSSTKIWSLKTGGLWQLWSLAQLKWNAETTARHIWSLKTGGLYWQWPLKTVYTMNNTVENVTFILEDHHTSTCPTSLENVTSQDRWSLVTGSFTDYHDYVHVHFSWNMLNCTCRLFKFCQKCVVLKKTSAQNTGVLWSDKGS